MSELTPMMKQYLEVKSNYQDALLFYRLGDFYELFYEDAVLASSILEIQLTSKKSGDVPMCGVPFHAAKPYINKLVKNGYKVAVAEQLSDPSEKGIVKRDVVRIVTPGINTEDDLESSEVNYLVAVTKDNNFYVSYLDATTGVNYLETVSNLNSLVNTLLRLNTKEVILENGIDIEELIKPYGISINYSSDKTLHSYLKDRVIDLEQNYINVFSLLTNYLFETQKQSLIHIQKPIIFDESKTSIDNSSIRNLELITNNRDNNKRASLFWFLDKTKTAFGSRFLKKEITTPLVNEAQVTYRHNIVEYLIEDYNLSNDLSSALSKMYDLERLIGKLSFGSVNPKELVQLKHSLNAYPLFKEISLKTKSNEVKDLLNKLHSLDELTTLLNRSLNDDVPISIKDLFVIKDGYNKELDELRFIKKNSNDFLLDLEQREKERTGIKSLKIGYNKIFGYYFEVLKSQVDLVKDEYGYVRKQTLANCERYINAELKDKENTILNAVDKITIVEQNLYNEILSISKEYIPLIQENANTLALVDMLLAFKQVSEEKSLTRPIIVKEHLIDIKDAFHPVIESLNSNFIKNDFLLDKNTNTLLITGPNMSGKSTYMRTLCHIVIMNQIGCFVPASYARVKIFDRIFTRIGASDDLVGGKSTFMVEMEEVNYAVSNSTKDSLIIFDEIGRGTATYDGLALAQSILEFVTSTIGAKTLFSTHYHELTTLENYLGTLKNVHVSAKEINKELVFFHKVKDGSIDKSYGINVASLAKLPNEVIKRAKSILSELEKNQVEVNLFTSLLDEEVDSDSAENNSKLKEMLLKINVNNLTPIEALNKLNELINEAKDDN